MLWLTSVALHGASIESKNSHDSQEGVGSLAKWWQHHLSDHNPQSEISAARIESAIGPISRAELYTWFCWFVDMEPHYGGQFLGFCTWSCVQDIQFHLYSQQDVKDISSCFLLLSLVTLPVCDLHGQDSKPGGRVCPVWDIWITSLLFADVVL